MVTTLAEVDDNRNAYVGRIDVGAEQVSCNVTWICLGGPAVTGVTGTPVILPVAVFSANAECAAGRPAGAHPAEGRGRSPSGPHRPQL